MEVVETGQPASLQPWEYTLRKYLLLLATLVVTVTYAAGFNPPGGVWQDTHGGQLAGDPIIRDTHHHRYLAFIYCNLFAFVMSLTVIVLILILAIQHDKEKQHKEKEGTVRVFVLRLLRAVMVLDLLSLMSAYGAGTYRDMISTVFYCTVPVATVLIYIAVLRCCFAHENSDSGSGRVKAKERLCKVLMLLATFAVSVTYDAGLRTPGGFWDSTGGTHRPGDAILKDHHSLRLTVFLLCNTTAFVASLLIAMLLIIDGKKLREKTAPATAPAPELYVLYACIIVALVGLVGAYIAGSCRETRTTVSVVIVVILILVGACLLVSKWLCSCSSPAPAPEQQTDENQQTDNVRDDALDKARSLVLLLATFAVTITYTAGLDPPGGLWQDNSDWHMAGDPILLTTNARRYKAFFFCNSAALVTSLAVIILFQNKLLAKHHVLEVAMTLVLFGLIGAYAAGSCRDVSTSIYTMALAGVGLVYVVIHVVVVTLDHKDKKGDEELLEKRRKRLLHFAILAATITYQAGLAPPGGFLLKDDELGHHAGDPVLLYKFPHRYNAFFYCNSVSFMLSIALIILLVNPNLYRPAIRSNALSVCAAVCFFCLMAGYAAASYAAKSTQDITTSIFVFKWVAMVAVVAAGLLVVFWGMKLKRNGNSAAAAQQKDKEKKEHTKRKYRMLLGIFVASVTYQAGLKPPGGAWQSSGNGYEAGNPVMHDTRRPQYLTFFYSNSISFVASILFIIMLLRHWLTKEDEKWSSMVMKSMIVVNFLALLVAYEAGSSRGWKTSVYIGAVNVVLLACLAIPMTLSLWSDLRRRHVRQRSQGNPPA